MNEEEVRAYYDDPVNAAALCGMLERAFPGWMMWREEGFWHARYYTWPDHQVIRDPNAGLLSFTMRMGGALP